MLGDLVLTTWCHPYSVGQLEHLSHFTEHIRALSLSFVNRIFCSVFCSCVCLCVVMCACVWSCVLMYALVYLCVVMCAYVCSCVLVCVCVHCLLQPCLSSRSFCPCLLYGCLFSQLMLKKTLFNPPTFTCHVYMYRMLE